MYKKPKSTLRLMRRYLLYLIRWQLSTPILAVCVMLLTRSLGPTLTTVIANLIGGLIFFWIDILIFRKSDILFSGELWEIKTNMNCADCGKEKIRGFRLVKWSHYDKTGDKHPEFRCYQCSRHKYHRIIDKLKQELRAPAVSG